MKDFYGSKGRINRVGKSTERLSSAVRAAGVADSLAASSTSETVATYLNKRLKEIGVHHVFAIPGDYIADWVVTLDNDQTNAGLIRVHPNNEMTATYSADG